VVGRRSGHPISFPLVTVVVDGQRYLVSMLGANVAWVRNLRAADGYALLRHGRTERVRLEEIPVAERGPVLKAYVKRAPGARPRLGVDKGASLETLEAMAAGIRSSGFSPPPRSRSTGPMARGRTRARRTAESRDQHRRAAPLDWPG
jgi:hypothetical protein